MSINKKQTGVDFLMDKLFDPSTMVDEQIKWFEKAKEMEKEQIVKAFDDGDYQYHYSRKTGNDFENGEEYFEELYGGNK
jgi:hypothetical protein